MIRILFVFCAMTLIFAASAQQSPDTLYQPSFAPRYKKAQGPVILIDEAHQNFHTATNRFRPFAKVLEQDGYRVVRNQQPFSAENLKTARVLVISNALMPPSADQSNTPRSAFTDSEIQILLKWIEQGGSLFLISDHMPFPKASEKLASALGFTFYDGFAMAKNQDNDYDMFSFSNNRLVRNEISGELDSIYSFTGQGFEIPVEAKPILKLDKSFDLLMPAIPWEFTETTPRLSASGKVQGAYRLYGKGKVVVFGEAAMFTAQRLGEVRVGFSYSKAKNNVEFLRRILHWLSK